MIFDCLLFIGDFLLMNKQTKIINHQLSIFGMSIRKASIKNHSPSEIIMKDLQFQLAGKI